MSDVCEMVAVIDQDGAEALYVDGFLHDTEGDTVYCCDIQDAAGGRLIRFRQVSIEVVQPEWPDELVDLNIPAA